MARPKKFARRIDGPIRRSDPCRPSAGDWQEEDRSDFVRAAVEMEIAIRSLDLLRRPQGSPSREREHRGVLREGGPPRCGSAQGGRRRRRTFAKRENQARNNGSAVALDLPLPLRRGALALVTRPAARCTARHPRRARVILIIDRDRAKVAETTQHLEYAVIRPESPGFAAGSIPTGVRYRKRETTGVSGDGCVPSALSGPSWAPPDQHNTFII